MKSSVLNTLDSDSRTSRRTHFSFLCLYMILAAVAGICAGMQKVTASNFVRQFAVIILIGLALTTWSDPVR